MAYFDLTTALQIQQVLTVSDADLPLEIIEGYALDDDLGAALDGSIPDWEALITAGEGKRLRLLRLFGKYFCAGTVARMAQVFILKKDTDGSNEGQRSDKDGWKFVSEALLGQADKYLDALIDDLGLTPEVAIGYSVFSRVTPDRDPITQPRPKNAS